MKSSVMTNEQKLLVLLSRVTFAPKDLEEIHQLINININYYELAKMALYHKTFTLVFENLIRFSDRINIPQYLYDVHSVYKKNLIKQGKSYIEEVERILEYFSKCGIDLIVVKGGMFVKDIYKNNGTRYLSDVDFLIKKSDVEKVEELMSDMGYRFGKIDKKTNEIRSPSREELILWKIKMNNIFPFIKENLVGSPEFFNVDFRFGISNGLNEVFIDDIFQLKYTNATKYYYMLLMHLCAHFYIESKQTVNIYSNTDFNLIKLCDIREFIFKYFENFSFEDLYNLSKEYGAKNEVLYTIYYLHLIYEDDVFSKINIFWTSDNERDLFTFGDSIDNANEKFKKSIYQRLFGCNNADELSKTPSIYTINDK